MMTKKNLLKTVAVLVGVVFATPLLATDTSCKEGVEAQFKKVEDMHQVYNTLTANRDAGRKQQLKRDISTETDKLNKMKADCSEKSSQVIQVEAGPIWNQADAEKKCPTTCSTKQGKWNGQWATTVPGKMSVCGCEVPQ